MIKRFVRWLFEMDTEERNILCPICYKSMRTKLGKLAPPELFYREHKCLAGSPAEVLV